MRFSWDPRKARSNELKHNVSFPLAQEAFETGLGIPLNERFEDEEWRTLLIAPYRGRFLLAIVFTIRYEGVYQMPTIAPKTNKTGKKPKLSFGSSLPEKPRAKKTSSTSQIVYRSAGEPLSQHDLDLAEKLAQMPDSEIDYSDIPAIRENTFANRSGILSLFKPYKLQLTLRLDADVVAWARRGGEGYQTRINAALRKTMMDEIRLNKKADK